ncbi:MAG: exo-alpha-sialidase [Planctomycetes bacterium]|nr:exo-alpha-sialidase [Planctomycetota bacterium]
MNYAMTLAAGLVLAAPLVDARSADDRQARPPIHREAPDDPYLPRLVPMRETPPRLPLTGGPFPGVQVNVDTLGNNIPGDAANEPSLAVDPTAPNRITIGWRQFDTVASNFRQAGWGYSHDGGRTWTFPGVLEPGVFRSDPVLDADVDGRFFYLSLTTDFNDWTCHSFESTDGSVSWQDPVFAFGGDKPWMVIDRTNGMGQGNIYVKWQTFFNCCGPNTFTRSTDGGLTFMNPLPVPLGPTFGTIAVGPAGEIYVAGIWAVNFQDFDRIVIARSTNAQNPLTPPAFELARDVDLGGSMAFGQGPNPEGLLGQVWVATDRSGGATNGNVYLLGSVDPPGPDPLDVMFTRSTDGGFTWSAPVRINDDPSDNGAWQWFGTMSVAPTGRIDVIFNDTRNSGVDNISELFYSFSTDGGQTWSANVVLSPPFDSHIGWPNQNKLGDYYHMVSDQVGANLAYAATFNGEQDVYFLRIGEYDCNDNGIADSVDLAAKTSADCNDNGIPDECEIAAGTLADANRNGIPDECEFPADITGPLGVPDGCVDAFDLGAMLGAWCSAVNDPNPPSPPCENCTPANLAVADISGAGNAPDGCVDAFDLAKLLAEWCSVAGGNPCGTCGP